MKSVVKLLGKRNLGVYNLLGLVGIMGDCKIVKSLKELEMETGARRRVKCSHKLLRQVFNNIFFFYFKALL